MENDVHSLDDVEDIISEMEKVILEEMLQGEMDSHLGYSKYDYENKDTDNSRNGHLILAELSIQFEDRLGGYL